MRRSVDLTRKMYDKFGLIRASKMMGVKPYEMINYSKIFFGPEDADTVIHFMMSDGLLPDEYKGFNLNYDSSPGTLSWTKSPTDLIDINVYATPFWEGKNQIPINIDITYWFDKTKKDAYEDNFEYIINLKDVEFKSIEELLIWFRDFYLPKTYNLIKSRIKA